MTTNMHADPNTLFRQLVGGDRIANMMDNMIKFSNDGYPPYNLIKTGDDSFTIELAVAGFKEEELSVIVEDNLLKVTGTPIKEEREESTFLHRGVARRNFIRNFGLADHIKVLDAQNENGLLKINLQREVPESRRPVKIEIKSTSEEKA